MATFLNESSWWTLLGTIAAFFVAITALALLAGVVLERHYQKRGLTIFAVKLKRGQPRLERLGNASFLVTWIPIATLAVHYELLRFSTGLSRELVTFGVCWVGFTSTTGSCIARCTPSRSSGFTAGTTSRSSRLRGPASR